MALKLTKKEVDEWMARQRDDREPKPPAKPRRKRAPQRREPKECPPLVAAMFASHGVPVPVCEYQFHPVREWRFDYCWDRLGLVCVRIALEVDGGAFSGGRHTRGKGFIGDQKKINEAIILGWRVLRCTPADIKSGAAGALIARAMEVNT